jgi:hypothetical protein
LGVNNYNRDGNYKCSLRALAHGKGLDKGR